MEVMCLEAPKSMIQAIWEVETKQECCSFGSTLQIAIKENSCKTSWFINFRVCNNIWRRFIFILNFTFSFLGFKLRKIFNEVIYSLAIPAKRRILLLLGRSGLLSTRLFFTFLSKLCNIGLITTRFCTIPSLIFLKK